MKVAQDWSQLAVELLPGVLQRFVELIGIQATMKLVEDHGGRRLYIPINPQPDHRLAVSIGYENLVKLSRVYGLQDHFDIPRALRPMRHLRDQKIRSEYGPKSASTLAGEYGLTERQIFNIVGVQATTDNSQSALFG